MSVIGKKPFVNNIIESLNNDQVIQVISLMNNLGNTPIVVSLFGTENLISDIHKGVHNVIFKLDETGNRIVTGILVYTDSSHCGLFAFNSTSGNLREFSINPINKTYNEIYEHLTVEELRQVCGDKISGGDGSGDSGGTKLYRHSVNFYDTEFNDYGSVKIILTTPTPIEKKEEDTLSEMYNVLSAMYSKISAYGYAPTYTEEGFATASGDYVYIILPNNGTKSFDFYSSNKYTFISDVVTEL